MKLATCKGPEKHHLWCCRENTPRQCYRYAVDSHRYKKTKQKKCYGDPYLLSHHQLNQLFWRALPLHSASPSRPPALSVNITINSRAAESAGPVLSETIFYLTLILELLDLTFYNVIRRGWVCASVLERLIEMLYMRVVANLQCKQEQFVVYRCQCWTHSRWKTSINARGPLASKLHAFNAKKHNNMMHQRHQWLCAYLSLTHTHTYSEGGALLYDGGQLREAYVHGQVPRLPVERKHTHTHTACKWHHMSWGRSLNKTYFQDFPGRITKNK